MGSLTQKQSLISTTLCGIIIVLNCSFQMLLLQLFLIVKCFYTNFETGDGMLIANKFDLRNTSSSINSNCESFSNSMV